MAMNIAKAAITSLVMQMIIGMLLVVARIGPAGYTTTTPTEITQQGTQFNAVFGMNGTARTTAVIDQSSITESGSTVLSFVPDLLAQGINSANAILNFLGFIGSLLLGPVILDAAILDSGMPWFLVIPIGFAIAVWQWFSYKHFFTFIFGKQRL